MTGKKSHTYFDNQFDKQIDTTFGNYFGMKLHRMSGSYCKKMHNWYYSLKSKILDNLCHKWTGNQNNILHKSDFFHKLKYKLIDNLTDIQFDTTNNKQIDSLDIHFHNMTDNVIVS